MLPPAALPDMLLVACNMSQPATAFRANKHTKSSESVATKLIRVMRGSMAAVPEAWEQWVAQTLDAELAENLFLAAAARRNVAPMKELEVLKPRSVPAAAVEAALTEAVQQRDTAMLAQLCKQGAAKACRTEAAMSLLPASFNQGYPEGAERLLGMPGLGKGLTPGQVASLLLAALQGPTTARKCISILLNVPAAQEMQWDSCEALLEAALMQHSTGAADVLPDLVGQLPLLARKMSFDQLQRTYQAAATMMKRCGCMSGCQWCAMRHPRSCSS